MAGRTKIGIIVAGLVLALAAPAIATGEAGGSGRALHASAELHDVGGASVGWARFTEDASGILHVNVHVDGLVEGLHGIHIHAIGQCTPTFAAAGGHHNPLGHDHGLDSPTGAHAGDLPNLIVNVHGIGHLDTTSDGATLSAGILSVFDADGSSLIVHADEDDQVTNPTGNSGGRIACGVIVAD